MDIYVFRSVFVLFIFTLNQLILSAQSDGTPDLQFGYLGEVQIEYSSNEIYEVSPVVLPDGKIIIASNSYDPVSKNNILVLTQLLPDGKINYSFGIDGHITPDLGFNLGTAGRVSKVALTQDGKLILVGWILTDKVKAAFATRLNQDGIRDISFNQNGTAIYDIGTFIDKFFSLNIKPDGKILIGGFTSQLYPTNTSLLLVQLLPNGFPDLNFGNNGIFIDNSTQYFKAIFSIALQKDGKIITFGKTGVDANMEIIRLISNGTIDTSFALNGRFEFGMSDRNDIIYAGIVQDDQKIIFCGSSSVRDTFIGEATLFRLNSDGSFDDEFGVMGQVYFNLGYNEKASTLVLQPDGKIIIGATGLSFSNAKSKFWVLRCNVDGSLDHTFGDFGIVQTPDYEGSFDIVNLDFYLSHKILNVGTVGDVIILWRYLNDQTLNLSESFEPNIQLRCQPNPFFDQLICEWMQLKPEMVQCDLYSAQGLLLENFIQPSVLQSGAHKELFPIRNRIPNGICFLVFSIGDERKIIKLIKQ